jgi:ADP-heptose:LPS heptosyltransferase
MKSVERRPGPLMIVHPGTSAFGAYKRWAPEKFGRLARRLKKERDYETLVTWGKDERPLAERVAKAGGEGVHIAPESPSLLHLAAYIRFGTVYVSADSGPLHIANYLGVPCLALFGPKDPALYRPYFPPSRVVRSDVDCSPCTRRTCAAPVCMERLEVEDVYEELCGLLDEACT